MINCQCVFKRLAGRNVLAGVDLQVTRGETLVLCGPSGTGKTTLLRVISGLETIDAGSIRVDGLPVASGSARALKGKVGMLFQHFNLFEHLNALDNIALAPRQVLGLSKAEAHRRAKRLLDDLGLGDKGGHLPTQLSGGEKQRVALARCLAMEPSVMLLDEPTSALDPARTTQVASLVRRLKRDNVATVIVSHDPNFGALVGDRVMSLDMGRLVDLDDDVPCCDPVPGSLAHAAAAARAWRPASMSQAMA